MYFKRNIRLTGKNRISSEEFLFLLKDRAHLGENMHFETKISLTGKNQDYL